MSKFWLPVDPVGTWEEKRWTDEDISKPGSNLYGKHAGFLVMTVFPPKKKKKKNRIHYKYVSQQLKE